MTITPFLTLKLRGKKDAILARQRARRVASLLGFDAHEQACIAAGTFVVACQALGLFGKTSLYFQIENHQLHIFAQNAASAAAIPPAKRLRGLFPAVDPGTLYRLTKPLPTQQLAADVQELGWLVSKVEETSDTSLFDEIIKQNQEILALLHEVRLYQADGKRKEEKPATPHAA